MNFISKRKSYFFIFFIFIFSVLINQYYGYIGVQPIDSFFSFNSGYDIYIGKFPFKDYWTITGPFIDFIQSFFFWLFGVSWFSYVLHASIFNFIFAISTFFIFYKLNLNINYCFLYAILVSILAYPSAGTPYVDHQSAYLSIMGLYCFILALVKNSRINWFFLPIIFGVSFLTKQAPTAHIILIIGILSIFYFILNFDYKKILSGFLGFLLLILVTLAIFYLGKIPVKSFFYQYILFPMSLGESRLDFLFPIEFNRFFLRFKLLHIPLLILLIIILKEIFISRKYFLNKDFLIILSIITSTFALISHQLMTINGIFIFFMVPILCGFVHIYSLKYLKNRKNFFSVLLLIISIGSTIHYSNKYINTRHFMDLSDADLQKAIPAEEIDIKLKGLKWLTFWSPEDPKKEILMLKNVINKIKTDTRSKLIVTDYQFISVILSSYDKSPNKYWYRKHAYPGLNEKYFDIYKNFFIEKLKENQIEVVYTIKPMHGEYDALETILNKDCIKKSQISESLQVQLLVNCKELFN